MIPLEDQLVFGQTMERVDRRIGCREGYLYSVICLYVCNCQVVFLQRKNNYTRGVCWSVAVVSVHDVRSCAWNTS